MAWVSGMVSILAGAAGRISSAAVRGEIREDVDAPSSPHPGEKRKTLLMGILGGKPAGWGTGY